MTKARDIASAVPAPSTVSSAELGHLDGVTSAIQTQIDSKIAQATAINPTLVDAKGDIIAATAADTVARLAVGATNGMVLTVDSAEATGLKYALPAGGGSNFSLLNSGGTTLSGSSTVTVSGISGKDKIWVLVDGATAASAINLDFRLNADAGSNYASVGFRLELGASYNEAAYATQSNLTGDAIGLATTGAASVVANANVLITGANASGVKQWNSIGQGNGSVGSRQAFRGGVYNSSSTISSISILGTANFTGGKVFVYTSA